MTTLMQASRQWSTRPDDQRFTSLHALADYVGDQRRNSKSVVVSSRKLEVRPAASDEIKGLRVHGPNGHGYEPTHWSFGQLATLAGAPAGYLRTLPAPIAADALNYGLKFSRDIEDVGVMLRRKDESAEIVAATGPRYGRIWNTAIADNLVDRFGDGISGDWRVPGEFGRDVTVTKANTTLYASDRDMFVFLADEHNRIQLPNRRDGKAGSLARGFFVWNSEVGASTIGVAFFLFDYVCCNRIVWGAEGYREIKLRHTVSAPDRWLEEVTPVLEQYGEASARPIEECLQAAQAKKLDDVETFLKSRFSANIARKLQNVHETEEGRPIETLWDAATAVTAHARSIKWQDERVAMEREGGKLLDLAV